MSALFRAKRTWWFSQAGSWTDGAVIPTITLPSAQARIGAITGGVNPNKSFTAPRSFIKNTTYTFMCGPGTFQCYIGYPNSSGWYSYWNAKGSFRSQNPYAPTTTTTVRRRTVNDDYKTSLMGWLTHTQTVQTEMGKATRTVMVPTHPPTAMYTLITPTEGGCTGVLTGTNPDCPGTTQFNGDYTASRGGSIMVTPGSNRFGGTMRFFNGPNARFYQLITIDGPYTSVPWGQGPPTSQQYAAFAGPMKVGEVTATPYSKGIRYRLTEPDHISKLIIGTTPSGGPKYYQKTVQYLLTRVPYTTGMAQAWQPNGNTNTIQTTTGYDNRTAAGLNGTISLVHPRLVHAYLRAQSVDPNNPIVMSWSSARTRKIDFTFAPEPAGVAMLAAGLATLAGLVRLRRR